MQFVSVNFFSHHIKFRLQKKTTIKKRIEFVLKKEKKFLDEINYIFCDDEYLLEINKKYLKHNFLTDIITFDFTKTSDIGHQTSDIFISIPRVKENAKKFNVSFENELMRVMIHGILHLCGYSDKSKKEKKIMRGKENEYLMR